MILPLDLRKQFLDIVQTPAGFQSHLVGAGMVRPGFRRFFNGLKTRPERLVDDLSEGSSKPPGNGPGSVKNIVVQIECGSHIGTIASFELMSRHQSWKVSQFKPRGTRG